MSATPPPASQPARPLPAPLALDVPVLPDDSEACVGGVNRALGDRGIGLPRVNGTCDAAYCYCGIRLRRLSCAGGAFAASGAEGWWVPLGEAARRLECDCGLPGLAADRLPSQSCCCPVLAAWLYAGYSSTGLDLPALPDDSEACVGGVERPRRPWHPPSPCQWDVRRRVLLLRHPPPEAIVRRGSVRGVRRKGAVGPPRGTQPAAWSETVACPASPVALDTFGPFPRPVSFMSPVPNRHDK